MRVLIDTNVMIDYIVKRSPYLDDAKKLIKLHADDRIDCCVAAHTITNLFYILRKDLTKEDRVDVLTKFSEMFTVISIDIEKLKSALRNTFFYDFEDCLQDECAQAFEADYIVTRNVKDFESSVVPAIEPKEFLQLIYNEDGGV